MTTFTAAFPIPPFIASLEIGGIGGGVLLYVVYMGGLWPVCIHTYVCMHALWRHIFYKLSQADLAKS